MPDTAPIPLERLFQSPDLSGALPRALRLSPDGTLVTLLRARPDDRDRHDLWAIDTATGGERMLVDSDALATGEAVSEAERMRRERQRIGALSGITSYQWAPDGTRLLVPIDGALWLADRDGGARRLTEPGTAAIDAKVSPGGGYVSFVRDGNLHAVALAGGEARALTEDGGGAIGWGTAEFVAQEELDRATGHWWSPDDRRIAVQRTDESGVAVVTRAAIGAAGTRRYEQRYPAAGTANAVVSLWLMAADGSARVAVDLGTDPDFYLARVDWAPDGQALYVQRLTRDQTRLDLLRVDPETGAATTIFSERSATWINLHHDLRVLADGSLLWTSERSGFPHLYHIVGSEAVALTAGDWSVLGVVGVDGARVLFLANLGDVLESHLFAIDLQAPAAPVRLTEPGWTHGATADRGAARVLVTRSRPDQPPQVYLADGEGRRLRWIAENRVEPGHPYHPYLAAHRPARFGTIAAEDGSALHWVIVTPPLAPGRRYPVFMEHYGGPHVQTVRRAWMGPRVQHLVAQGYVYFQIDNRGSAHRGRAFEDQIHRAMGTVEVADQLAGLEWLAGQPFVDPARIVTYGWSYGGYLTLKLLEAAPGRFAAGIAGAPVTRWELYDTAYTERYLGLPPYDAANAMDEATAIRDPLLTIHGMADDNVVFDHSTAFWARLQAAGVPFEMMAYPGKTHGIAGEGAQIHVWRTITDFLARRGLGGEPG